MAKLPNRKDDISVDLSAAQTDATSEEQKNLAEQQKAAESHIEENNNGVTMDDSKVVMTTDRGEAVANNGNIKSGNVKVKLLHKHTCVVGGERYDFEKGKVYSVPPDVKRILSNAGLLTNL